MKNKMLLAFLATAALFQMSNAQQLNKYYPSGKAPLLAPAYVALPFGTVKPQGWLDSQLVMQRNGFTGHIDELNFVSYNGINLTALAHPSTVTSSYSGWEYLYPYYEGLVELAYTLNDTMLLRKSNAAVTYFLGSAGSDGNFLGGTKIGFDHLCVCRALMAYYDWTNDTKVIPFLTNYFHYLNTSGFSGDGNVWSQNRLGEFSPVAQWLYNRTGDTTVLSAVSKNCQNAINSWSGNYSNYTWTDSTNPENAGSLFNHNVNIGEAFKYALYYLQSKNASYKILGDSALALTDKYHGMVGGRFDADEHLTGKQPTRGMELCGITETSYSMEQLFEGFGNVAVADRAEYLMYNCFAGTNTADMWGHQYDQQANQVLVNNANRPWNQNTSSSNEYGIQPNYSCCTCNLHATWPRFLKHMWMATQDNGLIAALYGPCQVSAKVGADSATVTITENTEYPFDGKIGFKITVSKTDSFPICFRIPEWENNASIQTPAGTATPAAGSIYKVNRTWQTGDSITLTFPMSIRTQYRWNNSISVMRGPLWYSLKIGETWKQLANNGQGSRDWEIDPNTAWNIGLKIDPNNPEGSFTVVRNAISRVPFAQKGEQVYLPGATSFTTWTQDPPVVLKALGRIVTSWGYDATYSSNASDPPKSPLQSTVGGRDTSIELIPYGSAKLRVTEFPWINTPVGVIARDLKVKDFNVMATMMKNGQCQISIKPAGQFDLALLDLAGRTVYHTIAMGPKSITLASGAIRNGAYVARLILGGKKSEEKILISQ
jgi:hypothetical protein